MKKDVESEGAVVAVGRLDITDKKAALASARHCSQPPPQQLSPPPLGSQFPRPSYVQRGQDLPEPMDGGHHEQASEVADGSEAHMHRLCLASESTLSEHQMLARGDPFDRGLFVDDALGPSTGGPRSELQTNACEGATWVLCYSTARVVL